MRRARQRLRGQYAHSGADAGHRLELAAECLGQFLIRAVIAVDTLDLDR